MISASDFREKQFNKDTVQTSVCPFILSSTSVVLYLPTQESHTIPGETARDNVGRGGRRKMECVAEDRRVFGITGDWSTAALDPGV